jgi:hypothetical protein
VAARYPLDPDYTSITGYSMGGYGTFKLAARFPDLFARAHSIVGPPALGIWLGLGPPSSGDSSNTNRMLESVRNLPFLMWVAVTDELVPYTGTQLQARRFDALGYRYEFDAFAPAEHLTLAFNDEYGPAAAFLGGHRVERDPAHVSYVVNPKMDFPGAGTVADHAYWLSGLTLRDTGGSAPLGTIDVRSGGFGAADPVPGATQVGAGLLTGGTLPALAFAGQSRAWGPVPPALPENRLTVTASNVGRVTIHRGRAQVGCDAALAVQTDGPLTVELAGCGRTETFGP